MLATVMILLLAFVSGFLFGGLAESWLDERADRRWRRKAEWVTLRVTAVDDGPPK